MISKPEFQRGSESRRFLETLAAEGEIRALYDKTFRGRYCWGPGSAKTHYAEIVTVAVEKDKVTAYGFKGVMAVLSSKK